MKKVLFTIAAVMACVGMNAQFIAGGSIGFSSTNYDSDKYETATSFSLAPNVGYQLNDNFIVGAELGYNTTINASGTKGTNTSGYGFAPFAMYKFWESGLIKFYGKASIEYNHSKYEYEGTAGMGGEKVTLTSKSDNLGIFVSPTLEIAATDNLSLFSEFGSLGYKKIWDSNSKISLNLSSTVQFGLFYRF